MLTAMESLRTDVCIRHVFGQMKRTFERSSHQILHPNFWLQALTSTAQLSEYFGRMKLHQGKTCHCCPFCWSKGRAGAWANSAPSPKKPVQPLCLLPKLCRISIPLATQQSLFVHGLLYQAHILPQVVYRAPPGPAWRIRVLYLTLPEVKFSAHGQDSVAGCSYL